MSDPGGDLPRVSDPGFLRVSGPGGDIYIGVNMAGMHKTRCIYMRTDHA